MGFGISFKPGKFIKRIFGGQGERKAYRRATQASARALEQMVRLQREIYQERKKALPEAKSIVREKYASARQGALRSMQQAMGALAMSQSSQERMLGRVGAFGGMSSGALEQALVGSSTALGKAALGLGSEFQALMAQLDTQEAAILSNLANIYLSAGAVGLGAGTGATGAMLGNAPPSVWDRLIQLGSITASSAGALAKGGA